MIRKRVRCRSCWLVGVHEHLGFNFFADASAPGKPAHAMKHHKVSPRPGGRIAREVQDIEKDARRYARLELPTDSDINTGTAYLQGKKLRRSWIGMPARPAIA